MREFTPEKSKLKPEDRIFLNADFDGFVQLRSLSRDFGDKIHAVKFGMAFLKAAIENPRVASTHKLLKSQGVDMFLDSKFHEDADQMEYVIRKYEGDNGSPDFAYMSVTAAAEVDSLVAAQRAVRRAKIVASLSSSKSSLFPIEIERLTEANKKLENPIGIVMANVNDIKRVKSAGDFAVVATGIRMPGQDPNTHPTVMTPAEALSAGADLLSVGRAAGDDRIAGVQEILESMRESARLT